MDKQERRYPTIQLSGIKKIYHIGGETLAALVGINTNIYQGEFAALMGPSGSGKSTLMNILGCLDRPTEGSYKLDGEEVAGLSDDELAITRNKKIGFVFQNFNLLSRISALENVALPPAYAGVGRKERLERAMYYLESVGLGDRAEHQPNELSGGQRQNPRQLPGRRVNDPHIIMADEPTGNLIRNRRERSWVYLNTCMRKAARLSWSHMSRRLPLREPANGLVRDGQITRDEGKGVIMDVV